MIGGYPVRLPLGKDPVTGRTVVLNGGVPVKVRWDPLLKRWLQVAARRTRRPVHRPGKLDLTY